MFVFFWQKVERNYAFEIPDVPSQCDYLEVRYSVSRHMNITLTDAPALQVIMFFCLFL